MTSPPQALPALYIFRRKKGGLGGAEKVMERFAHSMQAQWKVEVVTEGTTFLGKTIGAAGGPSWWRAFRYAADANHLLSAQQGCLSFSMERGPKAHVYRAGDGVHRRWIELRYQGFPRWIFNPWHWIAPQLERMTLEHVQTIVANSQMVQKDLTRFYPEFADKVKVIYNGFDPDVFKPPEQSKRAIRESLKLPSMDKLLLFCGSGWERKGLKESLVFLEKLKTVEPDSDIRLLVVGKGKPHRYRKQINALGLSERVIFHEPTPDIASYYQAADALILPTAYDPFSNACLEALACDCPVITTQWNGVAEVIEAGKTGFVLNDTAKATMQAAALEWLKFTPSPGAATQSVSTLTKERELQQLIDVFTKIS